MKSATLLLFGIGTSILASHFLFLMAIWSLELFLLMPVQAMHTQQHNNHLLEGLYITFGKGAKSHLNSQSIVKASGLINATILEIKDGSHQCDESWNTTDICDESWNTTDICDESWNTPDIEHYQFANQTGTKAPRAMHKAPVGEATRVEGKSFKEVLLKTEPPSLKTRTILVPSGTNGYDFWHGKALIGRMNDFMTLRTLNSLAWKARYKDLSIHDVSPEEKPSEEDDRKTTLGKEDSGNQSPKTKEDEQMVVGHIHGSSEMGNRNGVNDSFNVILFPPLPDTTEELQSYRANSKGETQVQVGDTAIKPDQGIEKEVQDTVAVGLLFYFYSHRGMGDPSKSEWIRKLRQS
ncbi:hypothetical protein L1987_23498 [Smallanthus sonchifolius]|uniref:Uncharacterized protein n=1 Tax=Smallanthus sonchifolius TaxID=185202 RepID=A0ACB9IIQ5_9ASTR|nr:hypothetical protein L1987_23498 [Smallanthus sonchifolius]